MKKDSVKRFIEIEGNGKRFEISKAIQLNLPNGDIIFNMDMLPDGTVKILWNSAFIEDITKIQGLKIIREDR